MNARKTWPRRENAVSAQVSSWMRSGAKGFAAFKNTQLPLYSTGWMDKARRDLIVQPPRHKSHKPGPRGIFSLRSPARPNPVAIATVRILDIDKEASVITIDAIECLDRTPLIDIKPWSVDIDILPDQAISAS